MMVYRTRRRTQRSHEALFDSCGISCFETFRSAKKIECFDVARVLAQARRRSTLFSDRKSTRLNSSHSQISYAVFCLKKKKKKKIKYIRQYIKIYMIIRFLLLLVKESIV